MQPATYTYIILYIIDGEWVNNEYILHIIIMAETPKNQKTENFFRLFCNPVEVRIDIILYDQIALMRPSSKI